MVKGGKGALGVLWSALLCALVLSSLSFAFSADRGAMNAASAGAPQTSSHSKTRSASGNDSSVPETASDAIDAKQTFSDGTPLSNTQLFTLQPNAQTYIVAQGQPAVVTVTVMTNGSGFSGYVSYACSDSAPESICIAPTLPVSSSSPASFTVTTTFPTNGSLHNPFGRTWIFYAALIPGLFGVFSTGARPRCWRTLRMVAIMAGITLATLSLSSCGNSSNSSSNSPGTPKGSYPITITATAASGSDAGATSQTTVTLTVQ